MRHGVFGDRHRLCAAVANPCAFIGDFFVGWIVEARVEGLQYANRFTIEHEIKGLAPKPAIIDMTTQPKIIDIHVAWGNRSAINLKLAIITKRVDNDIKVKCVQWRLYMFERLIVHGDGDRHTGIPSNE